MSTYTTGARSTSIKRLHLRPCISFRGFRKCGLKKLKNMVIVLTIAVQRFFSSIFCIDLHLLQSRFRHIHIEGIFARRNIAFDFSFTVLHAHLRNWSILVKLIIALRCSLNVVSSFFMQSHDYSQFYSSEQKLQHIFHKLFYF